MPLSQDKIENELCAECALEVYPGKFTTYGPDGGESWSFLPDGTFVVTDDNGTSYQYLYPYCLCTNMEDLELIAEDGLCHACSSLEAEE